MSDVRRLPALGPKDLDSLEYRYRNWAEAAATVSVIRVREAKHVPSGFSLTALQSFVPAVEGHDRPEGVVATFTGPGDAIYSVDQFYIAEQGKFDISQTIAAQPPPEVAHGVLELNGTTAHWIAGAVRVDEMGNGTGWDRSMTVLTWSEGNTGYRVEARGLGLAQLVEVAAGLAA